MAFFCDSIDLTDWKFFSLTAEYLELYFITLKKEFSSDRFHHIYENVNLITLTLSFLNCSLRTDNYTNNHVKFEKSIIIIKQSFAWSICCCCHNGLNKVQFCAKFVQALSWLFWFLWPLSCPASFSHSIIQSCQILLVT